MASDAPANGVASVMVEIVNGDYRCHPCVAVCNNRQMLEAHLAGKRHVAKIKLCGGPEAFKPLADIPDLPPRESQTLTPAGKKRKNISAQGNFRCEICEIDFGSAFPFESHMQGKKHANKVQKKEQGDTPMTVSCEICSVSCNGKDAYDAHVNGKKHLAKVANLEKGGAANAENGTNGTAAEFRCDLCGVSTTGADILKLHLEGKKHLAKVAKGSSPDAPPGQFHCEFCNVDCNSPEMFDSHRNGKKHAEKVRKIAEGDKPKEPRPPKKPKEPKEPKPDGSSDAFKCEVCNIEASCQDALDMHLIGRKHQKKVNPSPAPSPAKSPKAPKAPVDLSLYFCNLCQIQMNGPAIMETHLAGKAHAKKAAMINKENASALATSFVKSVREQTELMDQSAEKGVAEPQQAAPINQQPAVPIPAHASEPAVTASNGRQARSKRAI